MNYEIPLLVTPWRVKRSVISFISNQLGETQFMDSIANGFLLPTISFRAMAVFDE